MKKVIFLLLSIFIVQSTYAQADKDVSIFHRLLIFNPDNEVLVVKISNTDFWVTPGLYQTKEQTLKQGLDSISATYGITTKAPELKGVFILKRDLNGKTSSSMRNIFYTKVAQEEPKLPDGIEEVKWLPLEEALKQITFPHITAMVEQVVSHPENVWGGTLLQFKEGNAYKARVLEDFYPLSRNGIEKP